MGMILQILAQLSEARVRPGTRTWTVERVDALKVLWADGVAGGVIAKRLGITRGMVAGKRHSLGLPPRDELATKAAQAANGRRTALLCERPRVPTAHAAVLAARAAEIEAAWKPLEGSNPKPWELRGFGECAFPVQGYGAGTLSCCEPVARNGYCLGHSELLAGRPWPPDDPAPELAASQWLNA